jgi:parallel beta-helix repeat protein
MTRQASLLRFPAQKRGLFISAFAVAAALTVGPLKAATFIVDSNGDAGATGSTSDGICDSQPGGGVVCTLRAAIEEANGTAGADTITFSIGPATITLGSNLPQITTVVTIDGTTSPAFVNSPPYTPVIFINGNGHQVLDLQPGSSGSTIRGLTVSNGNFFGIRIQGSSNNVIAGNFVGTNAAGTGAGPGNTVAGIYIGGSTAAANDNRIGGTAAADRNLISANAIDGIEVTGAAPGGAARTVIQGNYIGTDVTGTLDRGNTNQGIAVFGANTNTMIGGTAPGAGNVVSGNNGFGILLAQGGTTGTVVQGNKIGTKFDGTGSIPNGVGIRFDTGSVSNNTIGGTSAAASNIIANNVGDGVRLTTTAGTGNSILHNSIYSNGELGIDLNDDGVTANDALDSDTGPNALLNFPVATAALASAGTLTVYFKLDVPAGWYRVEFFKNPIGTDPTGNGEGQIFAGSANVNHPGGGSVNFNASFAGVPGDVVTETTTACTDGATCSLFGNTSEFGKAVTAVTTAVKLVSFTAVGADEAVELSWRTGSELENLGFHLYRARSSSGPFDRITDVPIAGLGSSPIGAEYRYRDTGLLNGVTYFYELEDIETTGGKTLHGPVSATPETKNVAPVNEERVAHGNPADVSFRALEWSARGAVVELVTGGFYATPSDDGTFLLEVPGFEELGAMGSPALPVKRTWLAAVAGRGVRVESMREYDVSTFPGLRPVNAGAPEIVASPDGTVRAGVRRARGVFRGAGVVPSSTARVVETGFQEEVKKALVELAPLRWDGASGQLRWARRLQVRLSFMGVEPSERSAGGSRGRRHREEKGHRSRTVLAQILTSRRGLYRVPFETVFPARGRPMTASSLRLSHLGEAVAYHLEPSVDEFGPGSTLYFMSAGDAVYELGTGTDRGARTMPVESASPSGSPVSSYVDRREWEQDRYYQPGLLEAPSPWLWDLVLAPGAKSFPFELSALSEGAATLEVYLQGASDFDAAPDHHVRVSLNGSPVGEASWNGMAAKTIEVPLPFGVLREGQNELTVDNVGDTGAQYSMVFLDRFGVSYRRNPVAAAGVLEGRFDEGGTVSVAGLSAGSLLLRASPETAWLRGARTTATGTAFRVEPGTSYFAVSPQAVLEAKIRRPPATGLRSRRNRADYLLIGPRELLAAVEPLLQRRRSQKLSSRAVAIEDVYDEFGYGEARPEALKEFLEYAYQNWQAPSVRYVVLLGDATYDGKDHLKTGVVNRVPALMVKTSYLWTASDPAYAAVNGDDELPDLAIGRLPAASLEEARRLVAKVLAYEESDQDLSGPAVLVADNPDAAGDFEAESDDIAARLTGRDVTRIYLRELGPSETRNAILDSLDRGASLLSYVGHGGIALWADENVFESADVESLRAQDRQPIVLTMNCLNGYFIFPYFDALAETLVKAEGRGAIAAFSPSGLSLSAPAHLYEQALVDELTSRRHARLGDAMLAAQRTYADSGVFPELLAIYHLFGDPALVLH